MQTNSQAKPEFEMKPLSKHRKDAQANVGLHLLDLFGNDG